MSDEIRRVFICSPFRGNTEFNIKYARKAMAHSLALGEAPFAPHLLYTQPSVLDDDKPADRERGMTAGAVWMLNSELIAVYADHGISDGMKREIAGASRAGITIEVRTLYGA